MFILETFKKPFYISFLSKMNLIKTFYITLKAIYTEDGKPLQKVQGAPSFKMINKAIHKIEIYTFGKALCDAKTEDTIFLKKKLN
jgi:hypothetical protein